MSTPQQVSSKNLEDILAPRRLSNDFRWASRSFSPSPYFSRGDPREIREIIQLVLQSPGVMKALKEVANAEGKEETEMAKKAYEILQEMSHNFHLYAIRWFGLVLSKLGKRLYTSIFVNRDKLEELRAGFERYPVILLPTHRSYVDFLLLSYVCFTYNLPLPIIAAGMDFMNMTGVAEMLRKSGAFFIRRRFGNDRLYWALISEYLRRTLMQGGHPMEFFIEGTRSRTGKSLSPKLGLMTQIMDMVRRREVPDVYILPITMSYDRTLEETLYARELLGQPKPKESTNGLFRAIRWLGNQQYGAIYVNFGNFISARNFLQQATGSSASAVVSPSVEEEALFQTAVKQLSLQVIASHQENIIVPLFSAVATVALSEISQGRKSVTLPHLLSHITLFQRLLSARGLSFGFPLPSEDLSRNLIYLITTVHQGLVSYAPVDQRLWFNLDSQETTGMQLQHYSNQLVFLLVPFTLCSLISAPEEQPTQAAIGQYTYLRELFSEEFPYQKGVELMEMLFCAETWTGLRTSNPNPMYNLGHMQLCLQRAIAPFIISYWGVACALLELNPEVILENKPFGKQVQQQLRSSIPSKLAQHWGALSLDAVNNAVMSLIGQDVLVKAKLEGSSTSGFAVQKREALVKMRDYLGQFLDKLLDTSPPETTARRPLLRSKL